MRFAALLLFGALGCADGVATYSASDLRAVILVRLDPPRATAYEVDDAPLRRDGEAGTHLLGYPVSLESMRLRPGELTIDADGAPLPPPVHTARFDGDAWSSSALAPEVAAMKVLFEPVCTRFEVEERPFPLRAGESVSLAVPLDRTRVLAATTAGRFFIVTATASWALTSLSTSTPHLTGLMHDGELWLMGPGRRVVRGDLERGLVDAPQLPFEIYDNDAMVEGPREGAPFELFLTDQSLGVGHFDGARWRTIREGTPIQTSATLRAGIGWISPGLAVLLGANRDGVTEVSSTGETRSVVLELPVQPLPDTIWASGWVASHGRVLGSRYGVLHRRDGARWVRMPIDPKLSQRVDLFADLGDGTFLAGGQTGRYAQWGPNDEHCPEPIQIGREAARDVAPLGDGFVRFPFAANDGSIFIVTPAR